MKETIREIVIDSMSLEIKMLASVSAVVSPIGLFLKHIKMNFWKVLEEMLILPDGISDVLVSHVMQQKEKESKGESNYLSS